MAPNGRLIAWSADKGEKLLELPTGVRNGMGPPITFAVDGKQYIALMGGSGGMQSPRCHQPGSRCHWSRSPNCSYLASTARRPLSNRTCISRPPQRTPTNSKPGALTIVFQSSTLLHPNCRRGARIEDIPYSFVLAIALLIALAQEPVQDPVPTFSTTVVINSGLKGLVYHIPRNSTHLPNFARLKPKGTMVHDIAEHFATRFQERVPGGYNPRRVILPATTRAVLD